MEGNFPSTAYNVVKDQEYRGEIRVGLSFTPEVPFLVYSSLTLGYSPTNIADRRDETEKIVKNLIVKQKMAEYAVHNFCNQSLSKHI